MEMPRVVNVKACGCTTTRMFASPGNTKRCVSEYTPTPPGPGSTWPIWISRHSSLLVEASRWSTTRAPMSSGETVPVKVTSLRLPVRSCEPSAGPLNVTTGATLTGRSALRRPATRT